VSYSNAWDPGTLLAPLSTMLWVALFLVLVWALLKWISPYVMSEIADIFGMPWEEAPSALEILRQRYAAGEIDAVTFDQMRERLEASYHQEEQRRPS